MPTATNGCASRQPTALPLPSHPSAALPAPLAILPLDPPPPAAGVQDGLRLPRRDIRTVLWAVADTVTVRALAAGAAIGAKVLPAEGD